jgi:hypothetical protein
VGHSGWACPAYYFSIARVVKGLFQLNKQQSGHKSQQQRAGKQNVKKKDTLIISLTGIIFGFMREHQYRTYIPQISVISLLSPSMQNIRNREEARRKEKMCRGKRAVCGVIPGLCNVVRWYKIVIRAVKVLLKNRPSACGGIFCMRRQDLVLSDAQLKSVRFGV